MITKPIELTASGYWSQLEKLFETGELPRALCDTLKVLVNSHINKTNPGHINKTEIDQAKEFLKHGIELSDSATTRLYQVVVYMPVPGDEDKRITFFKLVPLYPGCVIQRLEEIT